MSQAITPFTIGSPGYFGLNTQDSPIGMNPSFALVADNCVIDQSGRIGSRKGWAKTHSTNSDLGTSNITCIGEVTENGGTKTTVTAGGAFLFKHSSSTLTTLTYGGGGAAPTISASNWQFCQLSGVGIFWQRGYDPLIYDPAISTTTFRRLSEKSGSTGTIFQCNTAISAYGRIWAADTTTDKNTIVWSDLLAPHILTGGTSGSLNVNGVWPIGGDEIVSLAAHNGFLFIFGKKQILIYSGADYPATMKLSDAVSNIGCVARDSITITGDDVIFLSSSGVRSLKRTIQEKSAPLRELSKNVRDKIQVQINTETMANVKAVFSDMYGFYLLLFPASKEIYCFDTKMMLEDGVARVTNWIDINAKCFYQSIQKKLYLGEAGYIGEYSGYLDDASVFRMKYYTPWIDFGNPIQTSILKKIIALILGGQNQTIIFKWDADFSGTYRAATAQITGQLSPAEYGIAEYGIAEYGSSSYSATLGQNADGTGKLLQFGFEADIGSGLVSIQKIDIFTKNGRL